VLTLLSTPAAAQESDFVDCPIPIRTDGYINAYEMIGAFSRCVGLNPTLLADSPVAAEIVDFGIYEQNPDGERSIGGINHLGWDDRLPMTKGMTFGIRAVISGIEGRDEISLRLSRPVRNAEGEIETIVDTMFRPVKEGQLKMHLFQLSDKLEMVPGSWVFEIHHQGKILALKRFVLVHDQ